MALPAKAKTWVALLNQRKTGWATIQTAYRDMVYLIKEQIKLCPGCTVAGSSNQTTGAMDATDRITSGAAWLRGASTTTAQSWIVFTFANMGGAQLCLAYSATQDGLSRLSYSPGGLFVAAGTATYTPTATDEIVLQAHNGAPLGDGNTGGADRIWNVQYADDGTALLIYTARSGAWLRLIVFQLCTSTVAGGTAAFSPAVWGAVFSTGALSQWYGAAALGLNNLGAARVQGDGGSPTNVALFGGVEATGGDAVPTIHNSVAELQGGGYLICPLSLFSQTAGARGKVGNVVDLWLGLVSASDGDTYPNDTSRQFVAYGDLVLPNDGSTPVLT